MVKNNFIYKLSLVTIFLGFGVVALGAYTRLKDAGLGCPDWPFCYGNWRAPISKAEFNLNLSLEDSIKAWIEMIHRYFAGVLGCIILYLFAATVKNKKLKATLPGMALVLVIIQAIFGMWTVTLKLYPIVVSTHLILGMTLISILWLFFLQQRNSHLTLTTNNNIYKNIIPAICLLTLIGQIFLGAWTSSNYAALVCADFPNCQGELIPKTDWRAAFDFLNSNSIGNPASYLDNTARVTIQFAHRVGALLTTILTILTIILFRKKFPRTCNIISILLIGQISLGITNIVAGLPIYTAVLHNIVALFLLLSLISLNYFCFATKKA